MYLINYVRTQYTEYIVYLGAQCVYTFTLFFVEFKVDIQLKFPILFVIELLYFSVYCLHSLLKYIFVKVFIYFKKQTLLICNI